MEAIATLGLIHDAEQFCTEVSLIVRSSRGSLQPARTDRTTEEFLFELQSSNRLVADHKELLREFLGECDMVKFAKAEPPETELRRLHEAASRRSARPSRDWVRGGGEQCDWRVRGGYCC